MLRIALSDCDASAWCRRMSPPRSVRLLTRSRRQLRPVESAGRSPAFSQRQGTDKSPAPSLPRGESSRIEAALRKSNSIPLTSARRTGLRCDSAKLKRQPSPSLLRLATTLSDGTVLSTEVSPEAR